MGPRIACLLFGPWPGACAGRARAQAGKWPLARRLRGESARASGKNAKAATLLLLYTPPRLVSSPGTPTEGQGRAVEHVKMRQKRGTKEALFGKACLGNETCAATPPCLCTGVGPVASAAVGKRGRLPKRMRKRTGAAR